MKNYFLICLILTILTTCARANSTQVNATLAPSLSIPPTSTTTHLPTETTTPNIAPSITPTFTPKPTNDPSLIITLGEKVPSPWYPGIPLFSPDGRLIALATTPRIRLWDTHTYQLVLELEKPISENCYAKNAAFSDDGDYFAVSITSCWNLNDSNPLGQLFVWDLSTGSLIHEWDQEYAYMVDSKQGEFSIPVYAMTFLPNSTKLAYATGNSIAIRDVKDPDSDPEFLSLGKNMYATEISVRDDSQYLFVLMQWKKTHDFPSNYGKEFRLQSWHLDPNYLNFSRGYPEVGWVGESWSLHKDNLLNYHFENETIIEVRNLTTNTISQFPNLPGWRGWIYFNSDLSLMIDACIVYSCDDERSIDLWNPDTWEKMYSFLPDFGYYWYSGFHKIAFSPDNTMLAISHNEQVTLWNINAIVNPNSEP